MPIPQPGPSPPTTWAGWDHVTGEGGRAGHAPLPSAGAAKAWAKYRTVKSGKFPSRTSQLLFIKAAAFIRAERESEEGSHKLGEAKRSSVSGLKTVPCP